MKTRTQRNPLVRNLVIGFSALSLASLYGCGGGGGGSSTPSYTVTGAAGTGGAIAPSSATVAEGGSTAFTLTPDSGYVVSGATGCGGTLSGDTYTTGAVSSDCTVSATFALTHTVSATAGTGGTISPASATVAEGGSTTFTLTPESGYGIAGVSGCGGTLAGDTYTTGAVSADCTVSATFGALHSVGGSVSGLNAGNSVTLQQGDETLTLSANGAFIFPTQVADGGSYAVTVATEPTGQKCLVSSGSGTVSGSDVADVAVSCAIYPLVTPTVNLTYGIKTLQFSWAAVPGATYYKLDEDPNGASGYSVVADNLSATSVSHDIALYNRINARYMVEACNIAGCSASSEVFMANNLVDAIGYFKASNTGVNDVFGSSVSLSADGTTLAVGAAYEDSNATGVGGDETNNSATDSGAVYLFTRSGTTWSQQAYLKASNTEAGDQFGLAVSLSADGNTLAVGASYEGSSTTGVDGDQLDNSAYRSGAAYLFSRSGTTWSQQAYLKASNTGTYDNFGTKVFLSADGTTLAVGADGERSIATGVDGDGTNDSAIASGAVYIFTLSDTGWAQQAYLKASNTGEYDKFGHTVSLSADGNALAVGAGGEDSSATGVDGDQLDNNATDSGAVYLFTRNMDTWSQQAYLKASNTEAGDRFGVAVSLSADGNTLAVAASDEDSSATGVDGNQLDNNATDSGALYIFTLNADTWSQQAYIKAANTGAGDFFGEMISISADGNTLAVSAEGEASAATGLDGDGADNSAIESGAAYLFVRNAGTWTQQAYIKASNAASGDQFGWPLSLSADGNTMAAVGWAEDSAATGIDGNQLDDSALSSGAVYLY